jgi:hypothetical protein
MGIVDTLLIVTALTAALWWAVSRHLRRAVLEALSFAAAFLAVLAIGDMRWQLVPWQVLAVAVAAAAALQRWRPARSAVGGAWSHDACSSWHSRSRESLF